MARPVTVYTYCTNTGEVLCQAVQLKHEHIRVAVAHSNQWREGVRGVACHGQYDDDGERR